MGNNLTGTIGGKSIIGTLGSGHIVMGKNVIPDWNQNDPQAEDYIKNRPGGYDTPPTVDIRWDGDLTGKEKVQIAKDVYFVKIANEAPSFESFKGNKVIVEFEGEGNIGAQDVVLRTSEDGDYYTASNGVYGVLSGYIKINREKLSKGLWFFRMETAEKTLFVKHITSLDGSSAQFPVKYMPNDITDGIREAQSTANTAKTASDAFGGAFFNDTVTFTYDGSTTGKTKFVYNAFTYYKISDYVPNVDYVERSSAISQNDRVITGILKGTNCAEYGGLCIAVENAGSCALNNTSFTAPERGLYACTGNASMTPKSITFNMLCDEHYMFLASSTSGSAKKFKMTVDDTGVPSFTDTGDATNKFTPVTPSELAKKQNTLTDSDKQSIVKTGMTSGAAWTENEQKAARERMGIPGDYELIEEITISEAIESFIRESTPDGTPYSLAGFFCVITSPGVDDAITLGQTIFAGGTSFYNYGLRSIDKSVNSKSVFFACVNNKILHAEQYPVGVSYEFANVTRFAKKFVPDGSPITKVQFNGNIPVNTKITIYGVIA